MNKSSIIIDLVILLLMIGCIMAMPTAWAPAAGCGFIAGVMFMRLS